MAMPTRAAISNLVRGAMSEYSRVVLDQLLRILLQPNHHLLADGDVEIDLDRPLGRRDVDAAGKTGGRGQYERSPRDPLHQFPARTANRVRQAGQGHGSGSLSWG